MKTKILRILKGFHISNFLPWFKWNIKEKTWKFEFTDSCLYSIDEPSCVNKLCGWCYGLFGVHRNSVRFGWTCEDDSIWIWSYVWSEGKLKKSKLTKIKPGEEHEYRLVASGTHIEFYIDQELYRMESCTSYSRLAIGLGFWFGGNSRAPHTMELKWTL